MGLDGLYYPFSRCVDETALKQLLLIFDSVSFLDPIGQDEWRKYLTVMTHWEGDDRFRNYATMHEHVTELMQAGVLRRIDPRQVAAIESSATVSSALSDLLDPAWLALASRPEKFGMPHTRVGSQATWEVFKPKLPDDFLRTLSDNADLRRHLVHEGDQFSSWILSYAAGSAICVNVHLAAAEQLGLSPVTDSAMHQRLLSAKVARATSPAAERSTDDLHAQPEQDVLGVAMAVIAELIPKHVIARMSLDQLMRFREQTRDARSQFVRDIAARLSREGRGAGRSSRDAVIAACEKEVREYEHAMLAVRDKVWPALVQTANASLATGGPAALALTMIGSPGYAVASSIAAGALSLLKSALDLRAERNKVTRASSNAVAYLSQIREH